MNILKTTLALLFIIALLTACNHTPQQNLAWRWNFTGIVVPDEDAFIDSIKGYDEDAEEAMRSFLLDYKLILHGDSTYDMVLFKQYVHGKWKYDDEHKQLSLLDETRRFAPMRMTVDTINPQVLVLRAKGQDIAAVIPAYSKGNAGYNYLQQPGLFTLYLHADPVKYTSDKYDPYAKQNNLWRIKPSKPETETQLTDKLINHANFCRLLMQNVVDGTSRYISLHSFRTPFIFDKDDIRLQHYSDIKDGWVDNFYDSTQAQKAFDILEKAVLYDGVKPGGTDDRFRNSVVMLDQVIEHLKKQR